MTSVKTKEANEAVPTDALKRVLVADDEHLVASGIVAHLKELGYQVVGPATNGREAMDLCARMAPDLALLDIRMPEPDGLDTARAMFAEHGVPIVLFSAYSDDAYVDGAVDAGVFGYLLKPVSADQLRIGLAVAWGRYREYLEQTGRVAELARRLEERKAIERAKWVLVRIKEISEPEAMRILQRRARDQRRRLHEVAQSILDNEDLIGEV